MLPGLEFSVNCYIYDIYKSIEACGAVLFLVVVCVDGLYAVLEKSCMMHFVRSP